MASPFQARIPSRDAHMLATKPANCRLAWLRESMTAGLMTEQKPATASLQLKIATSPSTHEKICAICAAVYLTEPLLPPPHCAIHQPMVCGQKTLQAVTSTDLLAGALTQPLSVSVITSW